MQLILRLFLVSIILSTQACQLFTQKKLTPQAHIEPSNQEQAFNILAQGMQYYKLDEQQQLAKCKEVKLDYKIKPSWQTAWLLTYSLNDEFRCLNLDKTLELLNSIQIMPGVNPQLLWLNKNQIQLFIKLNKLHQLPTKLYRSRKQNNNLQNQLNETEIQRQKALSKIQALKAIETSINKKLNDEQSSGK